MESELDLEVGSHLEMETEENLRRGMTAEEAERQARIRLGGVAQVKEMYRDQWGLPFLEGLLKDCRFAFRSLRRDPGFAVTAVLTLTLGIACATAIFTVVNGVLINPLGFPGGDRLVVFLCSTPYGELPFTSFPNYEDFRRQQRSFVELAVADYEEFNLAGSTAAMRVSAFQVTPGFFTVLGQKPLLGSSFPDDSVAKGRRLVVLSHATWQSGFGGDPHVIGRSVRLNDAVYEICGVMPETRTKFLTGDIWIPVDLNSDNGIPRRRTASLFYMFGQVKEGVRREQAQAEIDVISDRLVKAYPEVKKDLPVRLKPVKEYLVGDSRPRLLALAGAVFFVLLIACLNTGSLLLTRSTVRAREVAIRAAMGASRSRVLRQFLVESLLLAVAGTLAGLLVAFLAVRLLQRQFPLSVPRLEEVALDWHVLGFALASAFFSVLLFGLVPALRASRVNLVTALKEGAPATSHSRGSLRLRTVTVVSQVALSAVLVVGAGLLIKSYWLLTEVDLGFETEGKITAQTVLSPDRYKSPAEQIRYLHEAEGRLKGLPGVEAVGAANNLTFSNWSFVFLGEYEGSGGEKRETPRALYKIVCPGFFAALGIPLLEGRRFDDRDDGKSPAVMILDRNLANRMFPDGKALNRRVKFLDDRWWTVVGIVESLRDKGPMDQPSLCLYVPYNQFPVDRLGWVIRTSVPSAAIVPQIRRVLAEIDRDQPIYAVRTLEESFHESVSEQRFNTFLMLGFAAVALALAAVGLYGVLAFQVASRRREIGIRMAVGARRSRIFTQVTGGGFKLVMTGLSLGCLGAFGLTRFITGMLFTVRPLDWSVFLAVALLFVGVGFAALAIPAWKASRLSPSGALRCE